MGSKEKGELEEDSYKILSQFYKEWKELLYHMAREKTRRRYYTSTTSSYYHTHYVSDRGAVQIARSDGAPGDRQGATKNTSQVRLARIEESLREVGECMPGMPASERSKEDEIPTQVGGKLEN